MQHRLTSFFLARRGSPSSPSSPPEVSFGAVHTTWRHAARSVVPAIIAELQQHWDNESLDGAGGHSQAGLLPFSPLPPGTSPSSTLFRWSDHRRTVCEVLMSPALLARRSAPGRAGGELSGAGGGASGSYPLLRPVAFLLRRPCCLLVLPDSSGSLRPARSFMAFHGLLDLADLVRNCQFATDAESNCVVPLLVAGCVEHGLVRRLPPSSPPA